MPFASFTAVPSRSLLTAFSRTSTAASTAVRAVCKWAVTTAGIELIEWRCEAGNIASRRVAEKAGFLIEGTLRKRRVRRGVRVDE